MIVGIDGSSILPRRTGVGAYTFELLRALAALEGDERFHVFLNSLRHPFPADAGFLRGPRFRMRRWRAPGPWLVNAWRRWETPPMDWLNGRCDVFHAPATYIPPQRRGGRIATVHDLYFLRRPDHCHALGGQYLADTLPRWAPGLDRIIAVSHSTRNDALEWLGLAPEKVTVIYEGVDERFFARADAATVADTRARYGLPTEFLLSVATLEPRKNLPGLLRAYRTLVDDRFDPPPLALVGAMGWENAELRQTLETLRLGDRVVFTGFVDGADLPALYQMASLLVAPSLYEGFGLPLLEAMASGTPAVASATSSLGEIAADAALTVDPTNTEAIAGAIRMALEDTPTRRRLVEAGLARAAGFTWRRCAEQTLALYREVVAERR